MIKQMQSENVKIGRVSDTDVVLTISGNDHMLTVDQLKELRGITSCFWDANDLYHFTSEAIQERKHWESERTLQPMQQGVKLPMLKSGRY